MRARTAVLALLLAISCRKAPGPPDPNYQEARRVYDQLYVTKLDDAYGDPQMDNVVGLLQKVDHQSVDAPAAETLLGTIKRGREDFAKARAEREKMQKAAQDVIAAPNIDPTRVLGLDRVVDAGPPPDPFGPGASISEINAASGGCLVAGEQFQENVTNRVGTVYRLSGSATCSQRLAGFVGQAVLVTDGKIYRRVPDAEVRPPPTPDAGTAVADAGTPARDAGTGTRAAAAPAAPAGAEDAGTQQYMYIPGAPLPPGAQFPGAEAAAGQDAGY